MIDAYFEEQIEILVAEPGKLDVASVRKVLEKAEIEVSAIELAG